MYYFNVTPSICSIVNPNVVLSRVFEQAHINVKYLSKSDKGLINVGVTFPGMDSDGLGPIMRFFSKNHRDIEKLRDGLKSAYDNIALGKFVKISDVTDADDKKVVIVPMKRNRDYKKLGKNGKLPPHLNIKSYSMNTHFKVFFEPSDADSIEFNAYFVHPSCS